VIGHEEDAVITDSPAEDPFPFVALETFQVALEEGSDSIWVSARATRFWIGFGRPRRSFSASFENS